YQLGEVLRAARRLKEQDVPHLVVYWLEPGRLFQDTQGTGYGVSDEAFQSFFPSDLEAWLFCTHIRPHLLWGLLGPLAGTRTIGVLGYRNEGGTLDVPGMLMVNQCTWAHCLLEAARLLDMSAAELLTEEELEALSGVRNPHGTIIPFPYQEA
ncbi:MAG TPA: xylulose 5-phosphate 3-epimerase, partial [Acidobacteriota bacterium]|nr:xylulose 5-phosphate 3-epimerase [Acidobacteriota bacterium]